MRTSGNPALSSSLATWMARWARSPESMRTPTGLCPLRLSSSKTRMAWGSPEWRVSTVSRRRMVSSGKTSAKARKASSSLYPRAMKAWTRLWAWVPEAGRPRRWERLTALERFAPPMRLARVALSPPLAGARRRPNSRTTASPAASRTRLALVAMRVS